MSGEWTIDADPRVCAALRIGGGPGTPMSGATTAVVVPTRCEPWCKLGDVYFIADSDSDRQACVLERTLTQ